MSNNNICPGSLVGLTQYQHLSTRVRWDRKYTQTSKHTHIIDIRQRKTLSGKLKLELFPILKTRK